MIILKKLKVTIILITTVCIFMIGYFYFSFKSPQEPPEVTIIIGDEQLDYVIGKNQWNGAKYDREDTFKTIMKNNSASELPYITIGSTAIIKFTESLPGKVRIYDILLDESGEQIYSEKEIINIPVQLKKGKTSFEVKKHLASFLSSYYDKDKTHIRNPIKRHFELLFFLILQYASIKNLKHESLQVLRL